MVARKIYDQAYKSPGLSRVPPNFIAGEGAADFAWNNGIVIVPDDDLISPCARERYESWRKEILEWEAECPEEAARDPFASWLRRPGVPHPITRMEVDIQAKFNEAVPPIPGPDDGIMYPTQLKSGDSTDGSRSMPQSDTVWPGSSISNQAAPTGYDRSAQDGTCEEPSRDTKEPAKGRSGKMDTITDTVGVIAVDMFGHIAAGSSSGGIGMKHRGRVGPAALIGIGTHVIPVDPTDPEETTVAAVTSGTGEHIASSFGASTCASRLYYSQRMGRAGCFDNVGDEEAISAMIKKEFAGKLAPSFIKFSVTIDAN